MAGAGLNDQLRVFIDTGIYRFENSNTIFIDSVRVLNRSYTRFRVSPSYYSRFFEPTGSIEKPKVSENPKKRKRRVKKPRFLNEKEQLSEQRHQRARPLLLKAHEALIGATDLLDLLRNLKGCASAQRIESFLQSSEQSFVDLGGVWQAPMYDITLYIHPPNKPSEDGGTSIVDHSAERMVPIFNNLVVNETVNEVEAEFLHNKYILPKESCFYMSDLGQIRNLIPAESSCGFDLILVDPPWENGSAHQKVKYPTLPSKYFLSLPIKQLIHVEGAIVALWITNREKLHGFVEKELFPTWGVKYLSTIYWLKVKPDGSLISELDLFHHRPYECLLLGYCVGEATDGTWLSRLKSIPDDQILISIPGDYSRKPPIGELLLDYVTESKPARCIELFAREMIAGWTSWGNEPLHFQDLRYFLRT